MSLSEIALLLTQALFLLILALLGAGYLGRFAKHFELASHFRVQYLLALLAFFVIFLIFGAWSWAALAAAFLIAIGARLFPYYVPRLPPPAAEPRQDLRLLQFNVLHNNKRYAEFLALIRQERPDIIIAQEVTARWAGALQELDEEFPYSEVVARDRGAGLALFSRYPLAQAEVLYLGSDERPAIIARIELRGGRLSLFTFHPPAPLRPKHFGYRNEQLEAAGPHARALAEPKIVMGDFNVTPWSPYFSRLLAEAGLINARAGFGLLPTWPAWHRLPLLMIPIDHCLVSHGIEVRDLRTGPRLGSDHLPLIADLSVSLAGD